MEQIFSFLAEQSWFSIATAIVAAASAFCAATPTPKEGTWKSKVYKVIEFLAINIGKAKDKAKK